MSGTRPDRRQCSPAVAPRGDPGCGPGRAGSAASCSLLAAPARAPAAACEEGGVGETPSNSNSRLQSASCSLAPARCRRVRASKANLPPPLHVSMPSVAVGKPQRPGRGQRSVAEGPGLRRRPAARGTSGEAGRGSGALVGKSKAVRAARVVGSLWVGKVGCFCEPLQASTQRTNRKQPTTGMWTQQVGFYSIPSLPTVTKIQELMGPGKPSRRVKQGGGSQLERAPQEEQLSYSQGPRLSQKKKSDLGLLSFIS